MQCGVVSATLTQKEGTCWSTPLTAHQKIQPRSGLTVQTIRKTGFLVFRAHRKFSCKRCSQPRQSPCPFPGLSNSMGVTQWPTSLNQLLPARGESLPVVLSTEEYKTETDWEEGGGRRKRKQGSLISGILCAFYLPFLLTAVSALDCFPKEGSARATLTACLLHRSCQCTSQSHDVEEQLD